jgi:hypothetical protein
MLKTLDYMDYHSYFLNDVKMFYDIIQYHMVEDVIQPEQVIVKYNEPIEHIYFMAEGTASLEIKLDGEVYILEELK